MSRLVLFAPFIDSIREADRPLSFIKGHEPGRSGHSLARQRRHDPSTGDLRIAVPTSVDERYLIDFDRQFDHSLTRYTDEAAAAVLRCAPEALLEALLQAS